jgi:hypothetical protein
MMPRAPAHQLAACVQIAKKKWTCLGRKGTVRTNAARCTALRFKK